MFRKPLALALAVVVTFGLLAGCSKKETQGESTGSAAKEKVVRYNAGADFRSLDPALMTDLTSFSAENALFEGLVRITHNGIEPGAAAKWEEQDGGLKYRFTLRQGLKWSNGEPLTASDFVYSWTRALDPRTGSEYAYQLYYIKGGEALNSVKLMIKGLDGKESENPNLATEIAEAAKNLGVKAIDATTLEVTLAAPTPYFLGLTAFPTLHPVSQKAVESNEQWAAKPESYISNGPFKLVKWEAKTQAVLERNPHYWGAADVKIDQLVYFMVEEQSTALNMWETDAVDIIDSPPPAELARLRQEKKLQVAPSYGTYYYLFNTTVKPFDNPKVRKALSMAIDRQKIVDNILRGGQKPAMAFVAPGSPDADPSKDYRTVGGNLLKEDLPEAKRLLAEAGYPDGKGFPAFTFVYNTNETHKALAEAVVEMWKQNLGILSVTLQNLEWKVVLDKRQKGDYQVARGGWYGDYLDAMTFMDMYVTDGGNNDVFYSNKSFDDLIAAAKQTAEQKVRMEKMHQAEQILLDEMPILPIYHYNQQYLQKEYVQGVFRNALGIIEFKYADLK